MKITRLLGLLNLFKYTVNRDRNHNNRSQDIDELAQSIHYSRYFQLGLYVARVSSDVGPVCNEIEMMKYAESGSTSPQIQKDTQILNPPADEQYLR